MTKCHLCHGTNHTTSRHCCNTCGKTGDHRARDCPNKRTNPVQQRVNPPVQQVTPPAQTRHGHVAIASSIGYNSYGQMVRRTAYAPAQQYVNLNQPQFHVPQPMVFQGSGTNPQVFGFLR
jgi:hypothetical protein